MVHLSVLFSLAAKLICTEEGGWICATEIESNKEAQGKANNWIWLSLGVSVCSAMWLCLHSWSVCPGSSQQGAGFGTAGHSYSTSPLKNHWTPPSLCCSLFRNMRVQNGVENTQGSQRSLMTKHYFSYGRTFLFSRIPNLWPTDLALVLFWHNNDT